MRFLLSGYYGFGNLGDEALLEVIVSQLKTRYPYAEIDVLSAAPEKTSHELRVDATPRWDARAVRSAIDRADIVLSGGGGLLQNATSLRSLIYYAGILRTTSKANRKSMIFAQSIGPLDFWGRKIVKEWCKGVDAATVRDARSQQLLSSLLPDVKVDRTADPVFLYDLEEDDSSLDAEGIGPQSDPLVIFSVRKAQGLKERIDVLARAADRFAQVHGARVAFLPLGGPPDAEVSTQVIRKCKTAPMLLPECPLPRAASIIKRARVVVGMRLHALIIAARYAVPFLAIPYDPKVGALCDDLGYPLPPLFSLDPPQPRPDDAAIDALVDRIWNERDTVSSQLTDAGGRLRSLAERNFEVLDSLVREADSNP
ncbi:MAG TPA: polysaccharide pyruvyl transferase CsaB [Candidatus Baltobacteraceae bacterium]|nr:polysaccharide pyruvyl transferase CsaB [Candidatus Baltobacteraceae bacterium]